MCFSAKSDRLDQLCSPTGSISLLMLSFYSSWKVNMFQILESTDTQMSSSISCKWFIVVTWMNEWIRPRTGPSTLFGLVPILFARRYGRQRRSASVRSTSSGTEWHQKLWRWVACRKFFSMWVGSSPCRYWAECEDPCSSSQIGFKCHSLSCFRMLKVSSELWFVD